MNDVLIAYVVL